MGESWRNSTGCSPRTCLPSIAPLISLKVEVNSPMKSCLPLESQSHTMHCNRKEVVFFFFLNLRMCPQQLKTMKTFWVKSLRLQPVG